MEKQADLKGFSAELDKIIRKLEKLRDELEFGIRKPVQDGI